MKDYQKVIQAHIKPADGYDGVLQTMKISSYVIK